YTILSDEPLVIEDAVQDKRVSDNPLVTGEPGIRFYAGAPIEVDGERIGSLCAIDLKPNRINDEQIRMLRYLAAIASNELTNRMLRMEAEASTAAKTMFLANMSHEIRTPLAAVLGYAEVLSGEHVCADERLRAVGAIERNAHHLLQLLNSILDASKIEAGKLEVESVSVDPAAVVRDAIEMLAGPAELTGIRIHLDDRCDPAHRALTDPIRLRQVVVNLLSNAIKFSNGQDVEVSVRSTAKGPQTLGVVIEVTDHGIGMTPEQIQRIFQPFQQADASLTRRFGGTGLGLAITQRLTTILGGRISVESSVGSGSCFRMDFDFTSTTAPEPEITGETANSTSLAVTRLDGLRILLVEDGEDNQRLLTHFLQRAGAHVTLAADGRAALEAVDGASTPFDCILMDMQMPVMDGCEATRVLRSKGCSTPILMLTANTGGEFMQEAIGAGCEGYMNKPVGSAALIGSIDRLINERRSVHSAA
ncbi:MAG: ATP-binding protein, partial [Phycisphaerales bacterium]